MAQTFLTMTCFPITFFYPFERRGLTNQRTSLRYPAAAVCEHLCLLYLPPPPPQEHDLLLHHRLLCVLENRHLQQWEDFPIDGALQWSTLHYLHNGYIFLLLCIGFSSVTRNSVIIQGKCTGLIGGSLSPPCPDNLISSTSLQVLLPAHSRQLPISSLSTSPQTITLTLPATYSGTASLATWVLYFLF